MTIDLSHHGDTEVGSGLIDLAVNVRHEPMPEWLAAPLTASLTALRAYPDQAEAVTAVAGRHGREPGEVLLTAGAAQAFVLIAQALRDARRPVVVHPQFTEPEAALINAGHRPERVILPEDAGFRLDATLVPDDADLVFLGNPTNPTSVLHPATEIAKLARPGRVLVVDEAFADTTWREPKAGGRQVSGGREMARGDAVGHEPESLAHRRDLPGLVVLRSLTKTWGLAGLRIGYALGPAGLLARLATAQPLWAVSTPALAAAIACASPSAQRAEREIARRLAADRRHLLTRLAHVPNLTVAGSPSSAFVSVRLPGADKVRLELRERGYAVRRGDTFPGLGADWLRIAVRDTAITDAFVETLTAVIEERL